MKHYSIYYAHILLVLSLLVSVESKMDRRLRGHDVAAGRFQLHSKVAASKLNQAKRITMCSVNQRLCATESLHLYRLAHVIGALLDQHQIAWWATGGTLLGAVRNKGIIPHDNDIDYNILDDQSDILLSQDFGLALQKNGLKMHNVEEGFWQIKPVGSEADIIHVDIFSMYRNIYDNELGYPHHWWSHDRFPESLCTPTGQPGEGNCPQLVRWQFGDSGTVWGPPEDMAKGYLNHVYGDDWHTPKCEDTSHPCGLIQNLTHDATECAEPSGPLLEPL